jgi:hypothetical protein
MSVFFFLVCHMFGKSFTVDRCREIQYYKGMVDEEGGLWKSNLFHFKLLNC